MRRAIQLRPSTAMSHRPWVAVAAAAALMLLTLGCGQSHDTASSTPPASHSPTSASTATSRVTDAVTGAASANTIPEAIPARTNEHYVDPTTMPALGAGQRLGDAPEQPITRCTDVPPLPADAPIDTTLNRDAGLIQLGLPDDDGLFTVDYKDDQTCEDRDDIQRVLRHAIEAAA